MPTHRPGSQRCECAACGEWFSGLSGFDDHRTGPHDTGRRCRTPDEIEARGYVKDDSVWKRDVPRPEELNVPLFTEAEA